MLKHICSRNTVKSFVVVVLIAWGFQKAAPFLVKTGYTSFLATTQDARLDPITDIKTTTQLFQEGAFVGKRFLVVGGTKGIGRGISTALALSGASVDIVGRSKGDEVVNQMKHVTPTNTASFAFHRADLSATTGVKNLLYNLNFSYPFMYDGLVMTVGVWPDFTQPRSPENYDRVLFIDIIARDLVFHGLVKMNMLKSDAFVLNVLTSGQEARAYNPSHIETAFRKQGEEHKASLVNQSNLQVYGDLWLHEVSKRFPQITFSGTFPGFIRTNLLDATFGSTIASFLYSITEFLNIVLTEIECGVQHVNILASEQARVAHFSLWDHFMIPRIGNKFNLDAALGEQMWKDLQIIREGLF